MDCIITLFKIIVLWWYLKAFALVDKWISDSYVAFSFGLTWFHMGTFQVNQNASTNAKPAFTGQKFHRVIGSKMQKFLCLLGARYLKCIIIIAVIIWSIYHAKICEQNGTFKYISRQCLENNLSGLSINVLTDGCLNITASCRNPPWGLKEKSWLAVGGRK